MVSFLCVLSGLTALLLGKALADTLANATAKRTWLFQEAFAWGGHTFLLDLMGGVAAALAASPASRGSRPAKATRAKGRESRLLALCEVLPRRMSGSTRRPVSAAYAFG
ncbi:hypothetical protein OG462_03960 [Streptomyces sp. NBC_01077]|uniref:hypothetical protein n=1 Tax=Streptomyces sp. NBC_01077 TaxID=2903746 RepID=UPI003869078A|nr:hypothetical protein OG462_03960 [Streptomyces sp. NBC_01077]